MCGLMAFQGAIGGREIQYLADQARRRGPDSFGIAWRLAEARSWVIERRFTPSWPDPMLLDIPAGARAGIGHARLATSGKADTQPLLIEDMIFAHNGTVYDHERLAKRFAFELTTGNDSEVLARMFRLFAYDAEETIRELDQHQGPTSHSFIAGAGSMIWIASFGQPLYYRDSAVCSWRIPGAAPLAPGSVIRWTL